MGFNNLWIHFSFREFNCVSMSKIPSQLIQMESWARCLGGRIFSCSRWNRIFFFAKFWNSTNLGMHNSLDNRILVYDYFFTSQRQSHSVLHMYFFSFAIYRNISRTEWNTYIFTYFVRFGVSRIKLTKVTSKYFNGNFDHFICLGWSILFFYAPTNA